jgi:hypothetical protein
MIDLIIRTGKRFYQEKATTTGKQLWQVIFDRDDTDTTAAFSLDRLIRKIHGVSYRSQDTQSVVRKFQPGTNMMITVPTSSEKTPLSAELLDKVAAGVDADAGYGENEAAHVNNILSDHSEAHDMTKNKQALDVLSTGIFEARGVGGVDLNLDINFGRDASLSFPYNYTAGGATFGGMLKTGQDLLRGFSTPMGGHVAILGDNHLAQYSADANVANAAQNNTNNILLEQKMTPESFMGVEGLNVIGVFRDQEMSSPVILTTYTPPQDYSAGPDDAAVPFVDPDEVLFFSMQDIRYAVKRGIAAFNEGGAVERVAGDVIVDKFSENDPIITWLRSSTRHAFIPANINHTAKCTGTFA